MSKRKNKSAIPRHARGVVDRSLSLAMISAAIDLVNSYQRGKIGILNLTKDVYAGPRLGRNHLR